MPAGGLVVSAVIGIASLTVGAIQKSQAMKNAASVAAAQEQQALYLADQNNKLQLQIAQGQDVYNIVGAVAKAEICGQTQLQLQRQQEEGNILIIFGAATAVLTLGLLIFRHKKTVT